MAKTASRLTHTFCSEAKPEPKQVFWWDGGKDSLSGFCLRISAQRVEKRGKDKIVIGGSKSFWLKLSRTLKDPVSNLHVLDSKGKKIVRSTWIKIGDFPNITVENAREDGRKKKAAHSAGSDVKAAQIEQRNPQDINALVDAYLDHLLFTELRKSTQTSIKSHLKKYIRPMLGGRYVRDLRLSDVDDLYTRIYKQTSKVTANRVLSLLSVLCGLAITKGWGTGEGWAAGNPCKQFRGKRAELPRERNLSPDEFAKLGKALDNSEESGIAIDAIRFLVVTGLRLGECLGLEWSDVDFQNRVMTFRTHKTSKTKGTKRLPINNSAMKILRHREQEKVLGNPFVFPGHKRGTHFIALDRNWGRIQETAGLGDSAKKGSFHMHDFRRVFMTVCQEVGYPAAIADTLLGHSLGKIRDTYTALDPTGILAQASNDTAEWIDAALAGRRPKVGKKASLA